MGWAGWGAGAAGAGSAGGPSRWFLVAALVASGVVTVLLGMKDNWPGAAVGAAATGYFALRLFGGLGRERE